MSLFSKPLKTYHKIYPKIDHLRGTYRLRMILKKIAMLDKGESFESKIIGTKLEIPTGNNQGFMISHGYKNFQELQDINYIISNIKQDETFLDIGSSYGLYSFPVANKTGAEVTSIEALPGNTDIQELTEEKYNYGVEIINAAASNENGKTTLNISDNSMGQNSLKEEKSGKVEVKTVRIDDLDITPDYVKIDVEGAEMQVLKGMEKNLEEKDLTIFLEIHSEKTLEKFGTSQKELVKYLESKGYNSKKELNLPQGNINTVFTKS